jgi:hypothetical protein
MVQVDLVLGWYSTKDEDKVESIEEQGSFISDLDFSTVLSIFFFSFHVGINSRTFSDYNKRQCPNATA